MAEPLNKPMEKPGTPAGFQQCDYRWLPEGIHEMIYHAAGREAVDEYFAHFERAIGDTPAGATLRCLTNGTLITKTQPIGYMFARTRRALTRFSHRPIYRVAIISHDTSMVALMDTLFRALARGRDKLRFFKAEQRQEAIDWLLQEK